MDEGLAVKILVIAVFFVLGVAAAYLFLYTPVYSYHTSVAGIEVSSDVPFSEVVDWRFINLLDSDDRDVLACNFELSAVSLRDSRAGHLIDVRKSESTGIYIYRGAAVIEGFSSDSLFNACHAFVCLRDNISCPGNFHNIRDSSLSWKRINLLLDSSIGVDGYSGYVEVLGALGYLQGMSSEPVDLNGDGIITREEVAESIEQNLLLIFPYLMNGSNCVGLPFNTALQTVNTTNESFDCSTLSPAIKFIYSDVNRLAVEGNDIIVEGDDIHIHSSSILLRDIIAPNFILHLYGL